MSSITQCPQCSTRFKVSQEQLGAHQGLVRCGRCQVVFNATHYLYDDEPNPQLDLPILLTETQPNVHGKHAAPDDAMALAGILPLGNNSQGRHARSPDGTAGEITSQPLAQAGGGDNDSLRESHVNAMPAENRPQGELAPTKHQELDFCQAPAQEASHVADRATLPHIIPDGAEKQKKTEAGVKTDASMQAENNIGQFTLAQQIAFAERPLKVISRPAKKMRSWPWVMGCLLLLAILLAQSTYYFRVRLAANLPGLKPALTTYCNLLLCTIPLPHDAEQMSIESSDMEVVDPLQANVITFNALLRNHAPYTQAYPNLELTLTDTQDKALARRVFRPAEYLRAGEDEKQGVPANREISVKLHLDTTDLKPTGFRLFLFYPQ